MTIIDFISPSFLCTLGTFYGRAINALAGRDLSSLVTSNKTHGFISGNLFNSDFYMQEIFDLSRSEFP